MTMQTGRRSSTSRGAASSAVAAPAQSGPYMPSGYHPPKFITFVGAGFLAIWIIVLITEIQTTEAFILHTGQVNAFKPNWAILWQPIALVTGGLSPEEAIATIVGWGVELVYLGFVVGYEVMQHAVARSGELMGKIFKTGSWLIVGFNAWANFNYGTISTESWGRFAFMLLCGFIVGFFGTIGLALLEHGWGRA